MSESVTETAKRVWTAAYWFLTVIFIVTAIISIRRIRAGFLSNHAADVACPAWLYIGLRGLHGQRRPSALGRYLGATPERAALVLFGGSTLTELSQIWWPKGFFAGTIRMTLWRTLSALVPVICLRRSLLRGLARSPERRLEPALSHSMNEERTRRGRRPVARFRCPAAVRFQTGRSR